MARVAVDVVANTSGLERGFGRAGDAAHKLGRDLGLAAVAGVGALGLALDKSVKAATKFQSSMALIATQAHAPQAEVRKMSDAVVKLAGKVGTDPDSLAEGLYHLESAGMRGKQALHALTIAAEGAKVGHANLEDVTNALNATIVAGIKGAKNMSTAMGVLNATVGAGDMRMQDLAEAMGTGLLAKAKVFGVTLSQVGGALAVFGDNNIRGAKAATDLASAIRLMGAPSKAAAKELKTIGISSTELGDALRHGGPVEALSDLKKHLEDAGLTATQQASVLTRAFGGKQSTGILLLLGQLDRLKKKTAEIAKTGTEFGSDWEKTTKTSAFASEKFHATLAALEIEVGAALLPTFTKLMNIMGNLIDRLMNSKAFATDLKTALKLLGEGFQIAKANVEAVIGVLRDVIGYFQGNRDAVTALLAAFAGLGAIAGTMFLIEKATKAWAVAQVLLNLAVEANPFVLAATAIVALGAALVVVYERSATFRRIVNQAFTDVKNVVLPIVASLKQAWARWGADIEAIARTVWGFIRTYITDQINVVKDVIRVALDLIHGKWGKVWNDIKQLVSDVIKGIVNTFRGAATLLYDAGVKIITGLWDGLKSKFNDVKHWLGGLGDTIRSLKGPPSKDAGLLTDIGQMIMQGLHDGMQVQWAQIKTWIAGLSPQIGKSMSTVVDAAMAAINAKQGAFAAAFSTLTNAALTAFDAAASAVQTAMEKKITAIAASRATAGLAKALADAKAAAEQARQEALVAGAGLDASGNSIAGQNQAAADAANKNVTDPAKIAANNAAAAAATSQQVIANTIAANDKLIAAQQAVTAAQAAIQDAADAKTAAKQRKALDDKTALERVKFEEALNRLQNNLDKQKITVSQFNTQLIALFKANEVPFGKAATKLGSALEYGLMKSFAGVDKAAQALANKIVDRLSRITVKVNVELQDPKNPGEKRAGGGPVTKGSPYIVGEEGPEWFVPSQSGVIVPNGGSVGGGAAGSLGGTQIVVNVAGFMGTKDDLISAVRAGLQQVSRSNVGALPGVA